MWRLYNVWYSRTASQSIVPLMQSHTPKWRMRLVFILLVLNASFHLNGDNRGFSWSAGSWPRFCHNLALLIYPVRVPLNIWQDCLIASLDPLWKPASHLISRPRRAVEAYNFPWVYPLWDGQTPNVCQHWNDCTESARTDWGECRHVSLMGFPACQEDMRPCFGERVGKDHLSLGNLWIKLEFWISHFIWTSFPRTV